MKTVLLTALGAIAILGVARIALSIVLEEGWFKSFFDRIGITASNS